MGTHFYENKLFILSTQYKNILLILLYYLLLIYYILLLMHGLRNYFLCPVKQCKSLYHRKSDFKRHILSKHTLQKQMNKIL